MRHNNLGFVMLVFIMMLGLTAGLAIAQQQSAGAVTAPAKSPDSDRKEATDEDKDKVSPSTPVITMDGFCDPASTTGTTDRKACRTVVTRSDFEELGEVQDADVDSSRGKSQLVAFFVKFSLFAREAQKRGIDKDPRFQKKMELARIQLLSQMLLQDLQAKSGKFASGDEEKFFQENPALFEQATLLRVFIPGTKFKDVPNSVGQPIPESAPEMKLAAEAIYARARAGADFATLQKDAFEIANTKEDPPDSNLGKTLRDHLRRAHQVVFDLKPGEISGLLEDPGEGYYFYKIVSRGMPSFESVKSDVGIALQKHRMDTWTKAITNSAKTKLNERYFDPVVTKSFE